MSIDALHSSAGSHQSLFPQPSLNNTALYLWIGKNYRLQDIQLSKTTPQAEPAESVSGHPFIVA